MKKETMLMAGMKAQSRRSMSDMITLAPSEVGMTVSVSAFDHNPDLLNTPNGIVNLRTGEIAPHDPSQLHMKCTAVAVDFDCPTPRFDEFMQEVFCGNQAVIDFVMRWLGYCLTGRTSEEKMLFLAGVGANGKSVLVNLMLRLMGDYASAMAMATLMQQRPGAIRNDIAALQGVRLAVANEGNRGDVMDTAAVKSLTSGDPQTARKLYGEPFTFTPQAKIMLVSNNRPQVDGEDQAIWRRIGVVPFQRQFQPHEQDHGLAAKLFAEGPGILGKFVKAAAEWYRDGLVIPEVLKAATADYHRDMDLVGGFIEDRCLIAANAETMATTLYAEFAEYARDAGAIVPTQTEFGRSLTLRGITTGRRGGVRVRVGIALRPYSFGVGVAA